MADIVFRGIVTKERLKELAAKHLTLSNESDKYNPHKSPYVIAIVRQEDGNYIGEAQKFDKVVSARQADPATVLQLLLTHDGTDGVAISK